MVSSSDRRSIRAQSLRPSFVEAFEAKKITKLYEWQADAVQAAGVILFAESLATTTVRGRHETPQSPW